MRAMEIAKNEFESFLSVATSAHVEVYEKVSPHFTTTLVECKAAVLGDKGTAAVESGQNQQLETTVKNWVSSSFPLHLQTTGPRADSNRLRCDIDKPDGSGFKAACGCSCRSFA